jgi:hypothetical protein
MIILEFGKVELLCQGMESSQICILSSAASLPGGAGLGFLSFTALGYLGSEGLGMPKIRETVILKGVCVIMQPESILLPKPKILGSGHEKNRCRFGDNLPNNGGS